MKRQIWQKLRAEPRLYWFDIFLTLIPALAWLIVFSFRSTLLEPHCAKTPEICQQESVFLLDRFAVGMESGSADELSFLTQNFSGYLALGIPLTWAGWITIVGRLTPLAALVTFGVDTVLILQSVIWNGFFNETTKLLTQRPRPFVYSDPMRLGQDPAHYTSFYSGHTSFSASTGAALVLTLIGRRAPTSLLLTTGGITGLLIFLTGTFRVLAGRHFLTDVLAGSVAGILISFLVAYFHRRSYETST